MDEHVVLRQGQPTVFLNENDAPTIVLQRDFEAITLDRNGAVYEIRIATNPDYVANTPGLDIANGAIGLDFDEISEELGLASIAEATVPPGGSPGQILSKVDAANFNTQWVDQTPALEAIDGGNF